MTKEEFFHLAENKPEIWNPTIYKLIVYTFKKEVHHYRYKRKIGIWTLNLSSIENLYSTKEKAEDALHAYINSTDELWGKFHSAIIRRMYLDEKVNEEGTVQWWLYDNRGIEVDHSVCSDIVTDEMNPHDVFFGRKPDEIRFQPGDIVEYMGFDNKVYLTVLNDTPPSIEQMWLSYLDAIKRYGPNQYDKFEEPYFICCMKDMYYYIQNDGFDPDAPVYCFFKPTLPIPEKARQELNNRFKRWKDNVYDATSGKLPGMNSIK